MLSNEVCRRHDVLPKSRARASIPERTQGARSELRNGASTPSSERYICESGGSAQTSAAWPEDVGAPCRSCRPLDLAKFASWAVRTIGRRPVGAARRHVLFLQKRWAASMRSEKQPVMVKERQLTGGLRANASVARPSPASGGAQGACTDGVYIALGIESKAGILRLAIAELTEREPVRLPLSDGRPEARPDCGLLVPKHSRARACADAAAAH